MFKRDARQKLPFDLRGLSEAEVKAAADALTHVELGRMVGDARRRELVRRKKLHHRCVDRRCRRARTCTAGDQRCVCIEVARLGRRDRKYIRALRRRRRMRM